MDFMRGSKCTSFQLTLEDKLSQVMSTWVTRLDWHLTRIISTGQASIIMEYTGQIDKMGEMSLKYCPPNLNRSLFMPTMWIIRFYQVFKPKIVVTVALNDRISTSVAALGNLVFHMILYVQFISVAMDGLQKIQTWAGL